MSRREQPAGMVRRGHCWLGSPLCVSPGRSRCCRTTVCGCAEAGASLAVRLQGVKEEDAGKVEALIMETLQRLEGEGFTQSAVEAAVNTIEFSLR